LGEKMKKLQDQTYDISNRNKLIAELSYKFVTYIIIGINVLFIAPYVFRTIGCERATFHTEV
jgi:sphingosine-1-phosphate phosphatase 1